MTGEHLDCGAGYAGDRVLPSLVPPVLVSIRLSLVPGSKLMLLTPQPYFTLVQPTAALEKVEVGGGKSLLSLQEALPPARL